MARRAEVDAAVAAALAPLTVADADRRLAEASVPAGPVLTMDQALAHPAVTLVRTEHAALGPFDAPGPPIETLTTREAHAAPPLLGADRDHVLAELGFTAEDIDRLARDGAFGANS